MPRGTVDVATTCYVWAQHIYSGHPRKSWDAARNHASGRISGPTHPFVPIYTPHLRVPMQQGVSVCTMGMHAPHLRVCMCSKGWCSLDGPPGHPIIHTLCMYICTCTCVYSLHVHTYLCMPYVHAHSTICIPHPLPPG